ncbi:YihY/virulence factor BrkB family protein [Niallia circulans]|uniref:YihY/virulence factor BrkB family protein n=1 Tax=Niallia circulans TaxID=1397 RepID=A0A553SGC9_NIACI|nr:YihY/virulence factor BrkB family protein [Niallia circulans]TRZ36038.1 YihY/virulence factor BrkB family protein [Niallia circulans]
MGEATSFVKQLAVKVKNDDVFGLAAQLAYYFLLSIFPLIIFMMTLLPYLPITKDDLLNLIAQFAPGDSMDIIETNLEQVLSRNGTLLSFGIIATIWSASNGLNAIIKALNKAYEVEETRSFIVARAMSVVLTLGMIAVVVIALLLPVFGEQIGVFLFSQFNLSDEFLSVWRALRFLVSPVILFIVFLALYWVAPNKKITCVSAIPGALFASIGWVLVSLGFSFYVGNFGNYSATYGGIGAIIVLMIWFYLTGIIIIIGGIVNAIFTSRKKKPC